MHEAVQIVIGRAGFETHESYGPAPADGGRVALVRPEDQSVQVPHNRQVGLIGPPSHATPRRVAGGRCIAFLSPVNRRRSYRAGPLFPPIWRRFLPGTGGSVRDPARRLDGVCAKFYDGSGILCVPLLCEQCCRLGRPLQKHTAHRVVAHGCSHRLDPGAHWLDAHASSRACGLVASVSNGNVILRPVAADW